MAFFFYHTKLCKAIRFNQLVNIADSVTAFFQFTINLCLVCWVGNS